MRLGSVRLFLALFAVLLLCAPATFAQGKKGEESNTRSVQGTVTTADDAPVNGAVVQLKNTKTLQIRSYITKDQGTYVFHGLSTDIDYELSAQHSGAASGSKTLSAFDSRKQAVINLKLDKK
ncbi:MAG TPA: carboxypeptidase-like regulatory domain-containing protein [Bryobacteraceae bacterium]|nr:carboxypeptidase-like regulatory domain-containing protein [Bryobacteraceae bacterium]